MNLFDHRTSEALKQEGMERAATARAGILLMARETARALARRHGKVHMDDVSIVMLDMGIDLADLGPAAGSVFKSAEWEFTGEFVKSARITNHSRLLRVWRLR